MARIFFFGLTEDVAVFQRNRSVWIVEWHIHHVIHAKDIHRQTFEAVGQFARDRFTVVTANLLEIGELRHFHAIAPNFPAKAPRTQGRGFPVVLNKADVMQTKIDTDRLKRTKVKVLKIRRRRFNQHLILIVVLQTVRVFTIATIGRTAGRLNIGRSPRAITERTQCRRRVEGASTNLHVVGLQNCAALFSPVGLEPQDDLLERTGFIGHGRPLFGSAPE